MNLEEAKDALGLGETNGKSQCPNCKTESAFSMSEFNGGPVFFCTNGCEEEDIYGAIIELSVSKKGQAQAKPALRQSNRKTEVRPQVIGFALNIDDLDSDAGRNDNSNATRFVDEFENRIRYVVEWDSWLYWDKRRWREDSKSVAVTKLARQYAKGLWSLIGKIAESGVSRDELGKVQSFIRKSNDSNSIHAMLKLAKADDRVAVNSDKLNSNPFLLNVKNGTIDLRTGELKPHCQDDLITQLADVEFDKDAKCPQWRETLELIFDNDFELIEYVQKLVGYSASGDTGEHILPICYGAGENGKSTLWNPIESILGDYSILAPESLLLGHKNAHPTEKALLYQKRFVPVSEPPEDARLKESLVKELTGDETITARRCFEDFWSFKRTHTFWISTNHLPNIKGTDNGIWRRIKLIPFNVRIRDKVKEVRKDFVRELIATEASGILNWIVLGFRKWQSEGLEEPKAVIEATKTYRDDSDEIQQFISECCDVSKEHVCTANELYESFKDWNADSKITKTKFGKSLAGKFTKDRPTNGPYRSTTIYFGLQIKSETEGF